MSIPQQDPTLPPGVELRGELPPGGEEATSPEAIALVADLVRHFRPGVEELLARRREMQRRWDLGERPHFLTETEEVRSGDWTVAPAPADLRDRRVELHGPPDPGTVKAALGSGANVFVADLEDATSPTWRNVVEAQVSLKDAVGRSPGQGAPGTGRPREPATVLMVRPRGWHAVEKHVRVDGEPVPAPLWDLGLFVVHSARALLARGSGPYLQLPGIEHHLEARLWNEVLARTEEALAIPRGSVRAAARLEAVPAAFQMDEILWELRERSAGLALGRSGYLASFPRRFRLDPRTVLPDRSRLTPDQGFLVACAELLVQTSHRRGAHAIGGTSPHLPAKEDPARTEAALARVRADARREATDGFDGMGVAHPDLVPAARAALDAVLKGPNQIGRRREDRKVSPRDLLRPAEGSRTEAGLRQIVRVSVQWLEAWLRGTGALSIQGLREDASTAEICRALAWQWIRHGVALDDGRPLTRERFRSVLAEEMDRIRLDVGDARFEGGRFEDASALFEQASTSGEPVEHLTLAAQQLLEATPRERVRILSGGGLPAEGSPAPRHPDPRRWEGIVRRYGREEVERLRGSVRIEHALARMGAERLWELLHVEPYLAALGALSGNQAVQMVKAGLKAVYLSGWQVAAETNTAGQTYPDQSLYPSDSAPALVRRINRAFQRVDQIEHAEGRTGGRWFAPIVADAEAGFGGPLNAFELVKALVEAGAAGVHLEDQVASEKKNGHLGGKVLVPTSTFVRTLTAARLAADVMDVPTVLVARTDGEGARLLTSDVDPYDAPFVLKGERTPEGFHRLRPGIETAIARGLAYAPYADVIWCETQTPDLNEARRFAEGIHARFPGKLLAYNCSPSFNWRKHLDDAAIARFQRELGAMGYRFQFVTLAGFHASSHSMFELARGYLEHGMAAYTELQQAEFASERFGYTATRHQREVGTGYFDLVATVASGGTASTLALEGSTEEAQFTAAGRVGAQHAAAQVTAVLDEDHGRLRLVVDRLESARDTASLVVALEELSQLLREHFALEEHAKGFYGILAARAPAHRAELGRLVTEHGEILESILSLRERAKGPSTAGDLIATARELVGRIQAHEAREKELVKALG
jgi:malate synthase A